MKLKKIALACAMAFTLALPFSGFTANGPVSVVEAASSASVCDKSETTLTPTVNSVAKVTFTVTKASKVELAKDINTILGITMAKGSSKTIKVDGVQKKLTNKNGTIYIDNTKLVDYVKSVSTTSTTVQWTVDKNSIKNIQKFAVLSASYSYSITIDGVVFKKFTAESVNIGGKTYKYSVVGDSIVFEGNAKTALKSLKCATVKYDDTHTLKKYAAVDATPTKLGRKAYYKCTECGKLFETASCNKAVTLDDLKTSTFKSNSGLLRSTEGAGADGQWYKVKNGVADTSFTGFAKNSSGWFYCEKGKVNFGKKGIIKGTVNGETGWWFVSDGKVQFVDSVEKNDNGWWCIQKGKVNFNYTGLAKNSLGWFYCENGKVNFNKKDVVKGIVNGESGWWFVKAGKVQFTDSVEKNSGGWWCIQSGKVNFNFTGIAKNANGYFYCVNGKVDFSKKGIFKGTVNGESGWWFVSTGQVKLINSVEKNDNGWWAIENGKVNFNFTGVAKNSNGSWYCKGGKVQFDYSGKVVYNGKTYTIKNGKVQ